jgi:hypothetical protein
MIYQLLDPENSTPLMVVEADDINEAWVKVRRSGFRNCTGSYELEEII